MSDNIPEVNAQRRRRSSSKPTGQAEAPSRRRTSPRPSTGSGGIGMTPPPGSTGTGGFDGTPSSTGSSGGLGGFPPSGGGSYGSSPMGGLGGLASLLGGMGASGKRRGGCGGIIGIICGFAVAKTVTALTPMPSSVEPVSILLAVFVSTSIGLFFGLYPANRAARLNPIEALRAEQ